MSIKSLTVVCPVYNEAEVIEKFLDELESQLVALEDYRSTILLVVDRCTDDTLKILTRLSAEKPNLQILTLSARFGHQLSLLAGIDHARSDVVIMMDSDLQHPPALIPQLLAKYEAGSDVVYTVRSYPARVGFFKRFTSRFFYAILASLSQVPIQESAADFRLISRRVADILRNDVRERNLFLRGIISWIGFQQDSVEFQAQERAAGASKYSVSRLLRFGLHGIVSFSRRPLQAAISFGLLFATFGLAHGAWSVFQYFYYETPQGYSTLVVLLSIFSGVQLIFLGVIGEYVGSIFDEVKRRPLYIVDRKINFEESDCL